MSTGNQTCQLIYTSSARPDFKITLVVGPPGPVMPPGGGDSVPGWPIISGSIEFTPTGAPHNTWPIPGTTAHGHLPGQNLVKDRSVYGFFQDEGVVFGQGAGRIFGGSGTAQLFIQVSPPITVDAVTCSPWPPKF